MEKRNISPRYLLGVLDEQINGQNERDVNWSTSKIGGNPDWMYPGAHNPSCKSCNSVLPLVVQIYCPLEGSPYHRTIYIFGCVNRNCWNNPESWIALRSQKIDDSGFVSISTNDKTSSTDYWLENADDWGENNGNENFNQDLYKMTETLNNQDTCPWGRTVKIPSDVQQDRFPQRENTVTDADGNNVFDNEDGKNQNVILPEDITYRQNVEAIRNLQLKEQGNGIIEGAVGLEPTDEATAEVESPDEGTITIDTPDAPAPETIATLFSEPKPFPKDLCPVIKSWYLGVIEEPSLESRYQFSDHERELLLQYQRREGLNFNELYNRSLINNSDVQNSGETYEKSLPKHGDKTFHKLINRIRLCPRQLLRYSFDVNAYPVFISPPTMDLLDPGKCYRCGEPRSFELQLLPSMVDLMRIEGVDGPVIEFGIIILYTCRASCWKENDTCCEEKLVVQIDPDFDYYATFSQRRPH